VDLEIRPTTDGRFYYFYDTGSRRLIKAFVLLSRPRVETLCDIVLTKKGNFFTPRLTIWKRDKSKIKSKEASDISTEDVIAEGRFVNIKARVDVGECHDNFWKLVDFLRTCKDIELPDHGFRIAGGEEAELIAALQGHDKPAVLTAVRTYLGGQITEQDVQMLLNRRAALEKFKNLMNDSHYFKLEEQRLGKAGELLWQSFFEGNSWIFGYGFTLVACEKIGKKLEQTVTGASFFEGGGKRGDAVMRTKGLIQTLLFGEIKTYRTELLEKKPYREPDVFQVSDELSGAVSQVQKTSHKAVKTLKDLHRQYDPDGKYQFEVSTIRPRQVIVIGNSDELFDNGVPNLEKTTSFELYRRSQQGIEIITFDELYDRTKFIVESGDGDL
jgi:Domain of unknown function (DUF4263)